MAGRDNQSTQRKACPSVTLSIRSVMWTAQRLQSGLCEENENLISSYGVFWITARGTSAS